MNILFQLFIFFIQNDKIKCNENKREKEEPNASEKGRERRLERNKEGERHAKYKSTQIPL